MKTALTEPVYCLAVDDLEENLLSLEALLKSERVIILKARSGPEALELLLKHDVALALLDVQMPEMDGFELAEMMRGTGRTQRVPIIFLTAGTANMQRRFRGYEAGAVDFLQKPIEADILRSKAEVFFSLARQQRLVERQRDALQVSAETNAKLLLESQQYAAALQEADQRKDEFLANMSHEIRTPMNAVIGLANILANSSPLTPKQKEFIDTLRTSADALLGLINDLLDISKIESSPIEFEEIPFRLTDVVNEAMRMMQVRAAEKGLTLMFDNQSFALGDRLHVGDPARLRQILLNLCSNGIKFTDKGSITIEIDCEKSETAVDHIVLRVRDTGIGIPPEKLDAVFQKFVQADSSINRKYGGTGLGLAITRSLVERMGGTIQVESVLGSGSTFLIRLPLPVASSNETPMIQPTPVKAPVDAAPDKPRILLVEDHPTNVLVARTFIEEFGYQIDVAGDGLQALALASENPYAAILMDVQMPGMDGFEATARIREHEKQHGRTPKPIIGMTAHALIGDRERCLNAGMDDYITKPFNPDELEEKLATLTASAETKARIA